MECHLNKLLVKEMIVVLVVGAEVEEGEEVEEEAVVVVEVAVVVAEAIDMGEETKIVVVMVVEETESVTMVEVEMTEDEMEAEMVVMEDVVVAEVVEINMVEDMTTEEMEEDVDVVGEIDMVDMITKMEAMVVAEEVMNKIKVVMEAAKAVDMNKIQLEDMDREVIRVMDNKIKEDTIKHKMIVVMAHHREITNNKYPLLIQVAKGKVIKHQVVT